MRYCEALTTATGYGFWIFPPIDLQLLFDGEQIWWSYGEDEAWLPLSATSSRSVQFPHFSERFDSIAPGPLQGCAPPFLSAMPETGGIQIWTGLLARTKPGWSLAVRPPVNLPAVPGLATWEGIIETDIWFGPLFSNFRLTLTDIPVRLRAGEPFLQVQPLPQVAYSDATHASCDVRNVDDLSPDDWVRLGGVLLPSSDQELRQGSYAVAVRKRRLSG